MSARGSSGGSDQECVSRIRAGDAESYERLFRAYWDPLCRVGWYIVRDADEAREIVAKVFAVLWERRATWVVSTTVEAYLFGAVRNEARHVRRDMARRAMLLERNAGDDRDEASLHGDQLEEGRGAEDAVDLEMTLDRVVRTLPERYQMAIHLRWRRGMEYQEIGDALDVSPDAARMLVMRALGMLRRSFGER